MGSHGGVQLQSSQQLLAQECPSIHANVIYDLVHDLQMPVYKAPDTRVASDGLVQTILKLVARCRAFDRTIVDVGNCEVRDLIL
jgi:hypothetical protein